MEDDRRAIDEEKQGETFPKLVMLTLNVTVWSHQDTLSDSVHYFETYLSLFLSQKWMACIVTGMCWTVKERKQTSVSKSDILLSYPSTLTYSQCRLCHLTSSFVT